MWVNMESYAHGTIPEYGAIFMSSSVTKTECFKRKLFGLPYWLGNFVQQIKSGMILFLFEYEKRVLHGVFQAISDGAMNIVPHAYSSTGQQFPAQVEFKIIWCCEPLSENQFGNAIKENYFSARKFNFGLSEVQVRRLLSLFSLTKYNDQLRLRQLSSDSFECSSDYLIGEGQSVTDDVRLLLSERLQRKQMEGEDQVNTMQESVPPPYYNLQNIIPSTESPVHSSHMDNRNLTYNSGCYSNAQIMMPSLHRNSACTTSTPFQTSIYVENNTNPSANQCEINVSCSDPNLLTFPTPEFENDGDMMRSIVTSQYASHELNDSPFPDQNKQNIAMQENTEAFYMYAPAMKEFPIQFHFDSVEVSSMPSNKHTTANHGHECYGNYGSLHSDHEKKGSVFSRLAYPSDASVQEFDDYADHEKQYFDSSLDEVMYVLQQHRWQWEKTNHEMLSQGHKGGRSYGKKQMKSSLSSYSNCFQVSDEPRTNIEDSIDDSSKIATWTPFVNFKRRRKPGKVEDKALTGGQSMSIGNVLLSGAQQKRRKLIRPSFVHSELRDCGDANSVSRGLQGSSKESLFGERASSDPSIETNKTEKLSQAAALPDIIWLVEDKDKNIGSESVATAEDPFESARNGIEDRIASSNYVSDMNITSKVLGINESCSSTHKDLTSENHMASQNLDNSGLCSRQESSSEGSELNAGSSFVRVDEGGDICNEKELVKSTKIVDEPYQGHATATESTNKSSSSLNSASESVPEEFIERSKQNNKQQQQ